MLHTTSKRSGSRPGPVTRQTDWTLVIAMCWLTLLVLGLLVVVLYGFSVNGRHLQFITVGLLAAGAAMAVGALTGFLFGIPRFESLGKTREPLKIAEEYALIDCVTGGRLIAGFPVGVSYDANLKVGCARASGFAADGVKAKLARLGARIRPALSGQTA